MGNLQKLKSKKGNKNKSRLKNDKTINHLCQDLKCEDWIDVYGKTDAQDAYFYTKLYQLMIKKLFMLSVHISSYGCTQEVWRARGAAQCNSSFLSALQTFQVHP